MDFGDSMRALYVGPGDAPLSAWLHAPAAPWRDLGVVICSPFGREEINAHRTLRALAQALCAAELPAMRLDYPGCGDSCDDEDTPRLVERWIESIHAAVDELKRITGVSRIALVGLRLGATLAAEAALSRDEIEAFVGVESVVAGKAFVRELKALHANSRVDGIENTEVLESGGFVLSASSRDAIAGFDLHRHARAPAGRVLLIGRDDLPEDPAWAERLARQGAVVTSRRLPGYADMMLDAQDSIVPTAIVDSVVQWLRHIAPERPEMSAPRRPSRVQARFGEVLERPVCFDAGGTLLRGVLSLPADGKRSSEAILLLNAGSTRRVGPSRMYVTLSRRWAAQGHAVLRIDFSGLGDSDCCPGATQNTVYSRTAVAETARAAQYLLAMTQANRCHAVGVCAGAYHGLKAAIEGAPLHGVVAINPLVYSWRDGMSIDSFTSKLEVGEAVARYRDGLFSAARWRKLLQGQVDVREVLLNVWHRGAAEAHHVARDLGRVLRIPVEDDLAEQLRSVRARGVSVQFVFSQRDPGRKLLLTRGGHRVGKMIERGDIAVHEIPGADHTFTMRTPRTSVLALLHEIFRAGAKSGGTQGRASVASHRVETPRRVA